MSKRLKVAIYALLVLSLAAASPAAEVVFSDLDLGRESDLVFQVSTDAAALGRYRTAVHADLDDETVRPLTFFPEDVVYLPALGQVQVRNRLTTVRLDPRTGTFRELEQISPVARGEEIKTGLLTPTVASPDGRYVVTQVKSSPGYASLVLRDTTNGEEYVVAERVERSFRERPARFSPDGRHFVYSYDGKLFSFQVERFREGRLLDEEHRRIGYGSIRNARWSDSNRLYVVQGRLVHRLETSELFTRSLYRNVIDQAEVVGRLPMSFDGAFDEFWVGPNSDLILIDRGGRQLFLSMIGERRAGESARGLPMLHLPPESSVETALWSGDNVITVLVTTEREGTTIGSVRRIVVDDSLEDLTFTRLEADSATRGISRSPGGAHVALLTDDRVVVRRHDDWRQADEFEADRPVTIQWIDNDRLFVADRSVLSVESLNGNGRNILGFTQADRIGFDPAERRHIQLGRGEFSATVDEDRFDVRRSRVRFSEPRSVSERYRVYLDTLSSRSYRNHILVRRLEAVETSPLLAFPEKRYEPFPEEDETVSFTTFSHGSRVRAREVALVVNAVHGSDGLTDVLRALDRYSFEATFFVNGDFLRRNPDAARTIAESGHEIGNLFSSYLDLTDAAIGVTERFVRQGLAETEDLYFEVTGEELSLLWHAPYYNTSGLVLDAAEEAGYQYVGRDVDTLDRAPRFTAEGTDPLYRPTAALIDRIIERKKPGSIIDVTLGVPGEDTAVGGRPDYLFQRLDVLFSSLVSRGYSVVPVSTLIERAR